MCRVVFHGGGGGRVKKLNLLDLAKWREHERDSKTPARHFPNSNNIYNK